MMKRADVFLIIENENKKEQACKLVDAIDYFEEKFNRIRDLLDDVDFDSLDNIVEARNIANEIGTDLY